jgi:hypothetical protein
MTDRNASLTNDDQRRAERERLQQQIADSQAQLDAMDPPDDDADAEQLRAYTRSQDARIRMLERQLADAQTTRTARRDPRVDPVSTQPTIAGQAAPLDEEPDLDTEAAEPRRDVYVALTAQDSRSWGAQRAFRANEHLQQQQRSR